jgi:hypothetical protein
MQVGQEEGQGEGQEEKTNKKTKKHTQSIFPSTSLFFVFLFLLFCYNSKTGVLGVICRLHLHNVEGDRPATRHRGA